MLNELELIVNTLLMLFFTQLNGFKYFYQTLISPFFFRQWSGYKNDYLTIQTILICLYRFKWFQVLQCITKNPIKHQLFIYTLLNNKQFYF